MNFDQSHLRKVRRSFKSMPRPLRYFYLAIPIFTLVLPYFIFAPHAICTLLQHVFPSHAFHFPTHAWHSVCC